MKAWLVTWIWSGEHAEPREPVAAILSGRYSDETVARFVELLYMHVTSPVFEICHYHGKPSRNPFQAKVGLSIGGVPHGDRITCGHNPLLYARVVFDFSSELDEDTLRETLRWKEPPDFALQDGKPTVAQEARSKEITRDATGPMAQILRS